MPSHQVFIHMDQILLSLLFSRWTHLRSFSLSLYDRCPSSLIAFVVLHQSCSSNPMSSLYWNCWCAGPHYSCLKTEFLSKHSTVPGAGRMGPELRPLNALLSINHRLQTLLQAYQQSHGRIISASL